MKKIEIEKCTGLQSMCVPLRDYGANLSYHTGTNYKGIGWFSTINFDTKVEKNRVGYMTGGKKKEDRESIAFNFCPFCGADYRELGRI